MTDEHLLAETTSTIRYPTPAIAFAAAEAARHHVSPINPAYRITDVRLEGSTVTITQRLRRLDDEDIILP
jgi:hypothetical protein